MITVRQIQDTVCRKFDMTFDQLRQPGNRIKLSRPRHIAMYLARDITGQPWADLGTAFCRDHTSIYYAFQRVKDRVQDDPYLALAIREITAELYANNAKEHPSAAFSEESIRKAWTASAKLTRVCGSDA